MLHNISWSAYLTTAFTLLVLYWLFIGLTYFSKEIKNLASGKRRPPNPSNQLTEANPFERPAANSQASLFGSEEGLAEANSGDNNNDQFPVAYALAGEIKRIIKDAGKRRMIREELIQSLQSLVRNDHYSALQDAAFRIAINNLISVEAENNCSIHFSAEELRILWIR